MLVEKGTVLFRIDPKPFELVVKQKQALFAASGQGVKGLESSVAAARARVVQATADRDRTEGVFRRYEEGFSKGAFSEIDVENRRQLYLASDAALDNASANLNSAVIEFESQIDGDNPEVARLRAELEKARYDLERTVVRAPTAGYVTQLLLRPGMMATNLPLRPLLTFVHQESMPLVVAFRQNSALRLKAGYEAEIVYPSIPGRVFKGRVALVLPNLSEGQVQASGTLLGTGSFDSVSRMLVVIEIIDDMSEFNLPKGTRAQVAVYSDHFSHVAIMRRILLRMSGWQNYLYLDH